MAPPTWTASITTTKVSFQQVRAAFAAIKSIAKAEGYASLGFYRLPWKRCSIAVAAADNVIEQSSLSNKVVRIRTALLG